MDQFLIVDGVIAAQSKKVAPKFRKILKDFDLIIEIGTGRGTFTSWLHQNKNKTCKLISYDISSNSREVVNSDIDFRIGDCFDSEVINTITNDVQNSGKTLFLCDGGNKELEFSIYSKIIKPGDVIMLHDYMDNESDYREICTKIGWETESEACYNNIIKDIQAANLEKYEYDTFTSVLWGSFIKI